MKCIICGMPCKSYPAVFTGFIAELVFSKTPESTNLLECQKCGFRFFERRYTDDEMLRLYGNYRGKHYFAVRHRHEPWYTQRLNNFTTQSETLIRQTQKFILERLGKYCPNAISILDYAGDRGQYIPDGIPQKFVFDMSDAKPVQGVTKLSALDLKDRRFDAVMALNILEHVSSPLEEITNIAAFCNPSGTLIVSVPEEYPRFLPGYSFCARSIRFFTIRSRLLAMGEDLFSKIMKFKLNVFPPLSLVSQSEHLNFFTYESLSLLGKHAGEVAAIELHPAGGIFRNFLLAIIRIPDRNRLSNP
jgi:SAM-dependent methyltransferase